MQASPGEGGEMISSKEMQILQKRLQRIRDGETGASAQLYELMTEQTPRAMVVNFFKTTSPMVQQGVQGAVLNLLGSLPAQYSVDVSTTGEKLAALCYQLQVTGYMFRNAEYVISVQKLLGISGQSMEDYKTAFTAADADGDGVLSAEDVKQMFSDVYAGEHPPPFEVHSFMTFFDTNNNGSIEWEEFLTVLGGNRKMFDSLLAQQQQDATPSPPVSGELLLTSEGAEAVKVDAAEYINGLKSEVSLMKQELARLEGGELQKRLDSTSSLSSYLQSLPKDELPQFTQKMTSEVVQAMRMLVDYVLSGGNDNEGLTIGQDETVTMQREALAQLCLWQLVLGYRLREAEAKDEATKRIGN